MEKGKDYDNMNYGKIIRDLRIKNNLTQDQVAQITGFDTKYISQIETGRYMGTIKTMLKFCVAFNVTPNDILHNFMKDFNIVDESEKFRSDFSKLNKRDKKNILVLIKSMLSE